MIGLQRIGRLSLWLGLVLTGLPVLLALPVAAEEPLALERTQDGQMGPRTFMEPLGLPPLFRNKLWVKDHQAYRLSDPLSQYATLDKKLSHLCRLGAFRQRQAMALYAEAGDFTYGVALAEGANLHDPQGLARPGTAYFFAQSDTSYCEVFTVAQAKIARFGTLRMTAKPAKPPG